VYSTWPSSARIGVEVVTACCHVRWFDRKCVQCSAQMTIPRGDEVMSLLCRVCDVTAFGGICENCREDNSHDWMRGMARLMWWASCEGYAREWGRDVAIGRYYSLGVRVGCHDLPPGMGWIE